MPLKAPTNEKELTIRNLLKNLTNKRQATKTRRKHRVDECTFSRRLAELLDYSELSKEKKTILFRAFNRKF